MSREQIDDLSRDLEKELFMQEVQCDILRNGTVILRECIEILQDIIRAERRRAVKEHLDG